jgi:hypothetical protein
MSALGGKADIARAGGTGKKYDRGDARSCGAAIFKPSFRCFGARSSKRGPKSVAELVALPADPQRSAARRAATELPPPPFHLSPEMGSWWSEVLTDHEIDSHRLRTLQAEAEAWDRKEEAQIALAKHGLSYTDDKGMIRAEKYFHFRTSTHKPTPMAISFAAPEKPKITNADLKLLPLNASNERHQRSRLESVARSFSNMG